MRNKIMGSPVAQPFLKWVGGKRRMLDQYKPYIPKEFKNYHEGFFGAGAMFFHLLSSGALVQKKAYLSDTNYELIRTCWAVRDCPDEVISQLEKHKLHHGKDYYSQVRSLGIEQDLDIVQTASRMVYLNRTCFNGLYRLNRKGFFNSPMGDYKNPQIVYVDELQLVSDAFKRENVAIIHGSYEEVCNRAEAEDLVYLDPPYFVVPKSGAFDAYTAGGFTFQDHQELARVIHKLTDKKVQVMLSNSDNEFVRELYAQYRIIETRGSRAVNSDGKKRGEVSELLILNY